ncbi:MAG TPA: hypothetical protein VMQ67_07925, partial [Candidatus Saccharimonadales bacterium]|nr:hypothetical protein [Candidatus Saccharimonadales bacterium]
MSNEPKSPLRRPATHSPHGETLGETALKDAPATGAMPKSANPLTFHFTKSSQFRVIHASGAWYGGDPQQNLRLTFYNERQPIPEKVVFNINEQG